MDMSSLFIANEIPDRAPVNLIADEVETAVLFSKMIKIVKREACLKRLTGEDIDLICNTHYHFLQIYIEKRSIASHDASSDIPCCKRKYSCPYRALSRL